MADCEIECKECGWQGNESALESQPVESIAETLKFCPDCGGSDFDQISEKEEEDSSS
jgi:Zn finger protein HypA/HybF involved in hydrogenase expression